MCYIVVKGTKRCEYGHLWDAIVCFRQCTEIAEKSAQNGVWDQLCPFKDRLKSFFLIIGDHVPIESSGGACDGCRVRAGFEGRRIELEGQIAAKAERIKECQEEIEQHKNGVAFAEDSFTKQYAENVLSGFVQRLDQEQKAQEKLRQDLEAEETQIHEALEQSLENLRLTKKEGFIKMVEENPSYAPIWYGKVDDLERRKGLLYPTHFPNADFLYDRAQVLVWQIDPGM